MVTKNSNDSSRIPVLNGINYRAWRHYISYLLTHDKTLYTMSTTKPDQSDDQETKKLRKKWDEDDALAKALMLHHMKDNIIPLFEERPTTKEIMDALEKKLWMLWKRNMGVVPTLKYNYCWINSTILR
jgi:hypothetical protein